MEDGLKIFLDLNGVLVDLAGGLLRLYPGGEHDGYIRRLKDGEKYRDVLSGCWNRVSLNPREFWDNLKVFPWADRLVSTCSEYGRVGILTSVGIHSEDPNEISNAYAERVRLVYKYFGGLSLPPIFTSGKYMLAGENSILVDDTEEKLDSFREERGYIFLWPNQFHISDGEEPIKKVLGRLKETLEFIISGCGAKPSLRAEKCRREIQPMSVWK